MEIGNELKKALFYVSIPAYVPLLIGSCIIPSLLSRKIRSQKELDCIVKEESEKLGLENIKGLLCEKHEGYFNSKKKTIKVGGIEATRTIVKHELYHIKNHAKSNLGDKVNCLLDFGNKMDYFLRMEPQAILYQYGIRA